MCPACIEFTLGASLIGAANVVVSFRLSPGELAHVLPGNHRLAEGRDADTAEHDRPHAVPDQKWGQTVKAVVVPAQGAAPDAGKVLKRQLRSSFTS